MKQMKLKDARVRITNQVLSGIKVGEALKLIHALK